MPSAATLRVQIESALATRIPSALTPALRAIHPVTPTGIPAVDTLLAGGIPIGALTEIVGPECSGRTSLALSTLAQITAAGKVAAWIDVSDALHPESAAACGINLDRLLWVRCGAPAGQPNPIQVHQPAFSLNESYFTPHPAKKGLHGGGFGPHPRTEERNLHSAVSGFLTPDEPASIAPRCAEPQPRRRPGFTAVAPVELRPQAHPKPARRPGPLHPIDQALRVTDLLLQAGGFGAIVIDLAGIAPEHVTRVPASTWFRYRAAAEKTRAAILLLTQHTCAQSSAALVLRMQTAEPTYDERTVFAGVHNRVELARQRFAAQPPNVAGFRKPPQSTGLAGWTTRTSWAAPR